MTTTLRQASGHDLDALNRLERVAFEGDRFSRRQLWHLLNRAHAETWVIEAASEAGDRRLLGYGILLFRHASRRARLYSFCVHPEARGTGLGRRLLEALEAAARRRGSTQLGLEVRADNRVALGLYRRMGFRLERWLEEYYEDGCAAWQMVKSLAEDDRVIVVGHCEGAPGAGRSEGLFPGKEKVAPREGFTAPSRRPAAGMAPPLRGGE